MHIFVYGHHTPTGVNPLTTVDMKHTNTSSFLSPIQDLHLKGGPVGTLRVGLTNLLECGIPLPTARGHTIPELKELWGHDLALILWCVDMIHTLGGLPKDIAKDTDGFTPKGITGLGPWAQANGLHNLQAGLVVFYRAARGDA